MDLSLLHATHNPFTGVIGAASGPQQTLDAEDQQALFPSGFAIPANLKDATLPSAHQSALNPAIKFNHGTTTLGFIFEHGVIIAVDSRASMGQYIGSGTVKKVLTISPYLLGTMAGGAADCSFWERNLAFQCRVHELREGSRISVAAASKILGNILYQYKGRGLSVGTMIAGWDETYGPQLFYHDDDGTRLKGDRFSVGSGATYAYGVLDGEYKHSLTVDEAVELGRRSIFHATRRDAYSGGTINVFYIGPQGWVQKFSGDMNTLVDAYSPQKAVYTNNAAQNEEKKEQ